MVEKQIREELEKAWQEYEVSKIPTRVLHAELMKRYHYGHNVDGIKSYCTDCEVELDV